MTLREEAPIGTDFLHAATRVLQDGRRAHPTRGVYEAADVQWAWRADQHPDPDLQRVWYDGDVPVCAAAYTRTGAGWGADVLGADLDEAWAFLATGPAAEMFVADAPGAVGRAALAGFEDTGETDRTAWMDADDRPAVPDVPEGFAVTSYDGGPHWMAGRNGEHVAERLAETSLYRRDLDLALVHDDQVVGYALFWADPVTGVGMLEPMRVEEAYGGRGLGRVIVAHGLDRLAAAGCTRLKVSFNPRNPAAQHLYLGSGFVTESSSRLLRKPAT